MCGNSVESANHSLLQYSLHHKYTHFRNNDQNNNSLYYTLLFGKENMVHSKNVYIRKVTIGHIVSTEKFNARLFEFIR